MAKLLTSLVSLALLAGAAQEAQAQVVQGCDSPMFLDRTALGADRTLSWGLSIGTDPERCMTVRVGQTVVWSGGNFGTHPLEGQEGTTPNPISNHVEGSVTFTSPGTFGFVCAVHPSMRGAIKVLAATSVPARSPLLTGILVTLLLGLGAWWLARGSKRIPAR